MPRPFDDGAYPHAGRACPATTGEMAGGGVVHGVLLRRGVACRARLMMETIYMQALYIGRACPYMQAGRARPLRGC
ncbi:hypothetical protein ACQKDS_03485 [Serratia sp. NPDC078593]|uniref:hypothetical protein n=1 Tax=unclassified Serratia (in: enterobacteria) TaxID=2647522 RepID=UPI003D02213A